MKGEILNKEVTFYFYDFRRFDISKINLTEVKKTAKNYSVNIGGTNYYCRVGSNFYSCYKYCLVVNQQYDESAYFEFISKLKLYLQEQISNNENTINKITQNNRNMEGCILNICN